MKSEKYKESMGDRDLREGETRAEWAKRVMTQDAERLAPFQPRDLSDKQAAGTLGHLDGHAERMRAEALTDSGFVREGTPPGKIKPTDTVVAKQSYDDIVRGQAPMPDGALDRLEEIMARDFGVVTGTGPAVPKEAIPPAKRETKSAFTYGGVPMDQISTHHPASGEKHPRQDYSGTGKKGPDGGARPSLPDAPFKSRAWEQAQRLNDSVSPLAGSPVLLARLLAPIMDIIQQRFQQSAPGLSAEAKKAHEHYARHLPKEKEPEQKKKPAAPAQKQAAP